MVLWHIAWVILTREEGGEEGGEGRWEDSN